jgi:protein-tyrosine phosphatase
MAEGIMRKKIIEKNLDIEVDSAGTANYHVGEPPDKRAIQTARQYGINISTLQGRQFTVHDFDIFDRIYAMDSSNYQNIERLARHEKDRSKIHYFLNDGKKGLDVPDPWFGNPEGFFPVFDLLDNAAEEILEQITREIKK